METVSITDLKNQLSARMKRVRAGETLLVTDRKKPVALLSPLGNSLDEDRIPALIASGVLRPPGRRLNVEAFLAKPRAKAKTSVTAAAIEDRDGR